MKYLLASDYDGTFHYGRNSLEDNSLAVRRWQEAGNIFGIVTARGLGSVRQQIENCDFKPDFLLCNNGAVGLAGDDFVFINDNDNKLIPRVLEVFRQSGGGNWIAVIGIDYEMIYDSPEISEDFSDYSNFTMISVMTATKDSAAIFSKMINKAFLGRLYAIFTPGGKQVDVVRCDCDKAKGVLRIASHFNIEQKNIYTVGDSCNDLPMLSRFNGFAMENSHKDVISQIEQHTASVACLIGQLLEK